MNQKTYIGKMIRNFRINKLDISAARLGEMLSPPRSGKTISSWENARTEPDADTLIELCRIFNEPISSFYYSDTDLSSEVNKSIDLANNEISMRIQGLLEANEMTQSDLARSARMSTAQVRHLLSGRAQDPSLSTLTKLSQAFGVSLEYLATGSDGREDDPQLRKLIEDYMGLSKTDKDAAAAAIHGIARK